MQHDDKPTSLPNPQIYRQDDDGTGQPRYYDIGAMVRWAQENVETQLIKTDSKRASRLVENLEVDPDYVKKLLSQKGFDPILICSKAVNGAGHQIVDGNHRYVASCFEAERKNTIELIPAYILEPEEWIQFVVPLHEVTKYGLIDPPQKK